MKHNTDISKNVMEKVFRYEEGSILRWRKRYYVVLVVLFIALAGGIYFIIKNFLDLDTLALLTLFLEDWEIISEYWIDTLWTIWEESPHQLIAFGLTVCVMIILSLIVTRRKRMVHKKKMEQVTKFQSRLQR